MRLTAAVTATLAATALAAPVPARAAAAGAPCQVVDVSATRWLCAAFVEDFPGGPRALVVSTSGDNGRTWRSVEAQGVPTAESLLAQALLPASPATDPTLYLQSSHGLFASSDGGATFTIADYFAGPSSPVPHLTALVDDGVAAPGAVAAQSRFAYAGSTGPSAVVHPPFHLPVTATVDTEIRFLVPPPGSGPHRDVLVFALQTDRSSTTPRSRVVVYRCDAQLTCGTALHAFPYQARYGGAVLAPDFRTSGVAYAWTSDATTGDVTVWRSADGARTFSAWRAADVVTAPVNRAKRPGQKWELSLAGDPRRPATLYARARHIPSATGGPPRDQVFRSTDGGRRWVRVAHTGTVPWIGGGNTAPGHYAALTIAPNGHLVVLAFAEGYQGIFCSTDGGRRWARACPPT